MLSKLKFHKPTVFFSCFLGATIGTLFARIVFRAGFELTTAILVVVLLWTVYIIARIAYINNERLDKLEAFCHEYSPDGETNADQK